MPRLEVLSPSPVCIGNYSVICSLNYSLARSIINIALATKSNMNRASALYSSQANLKSKPTRELIDNKSKLQDWANETEMHIHTHEHEHASRQLIELGFSLSLSAHRAGFLSGRVYPNPVPSRPILSSILSDSLYFMLAIESNAPRNYPLSFSLSLSHPLSPSPLSPSCVC